MNPQTTSEFRPIPATPAMRDVIALAKPRITLVVVLTALLGMLMAQGPMPSLLTSLGTSVGLALIVGGANALNMYVERESDRYMSRTAKRPLPDRRMHPRYALVFGALLSVAAVPVLWWASNPLTTGLAIFSNLSYVLAYTPLKQRSWTAVLVGAVPGAMPPLLGWTAATNGIGRGGLALFVILFIWQVPHFYAISIFRQTEYEQAGLKVFPSIYGIESTKRHIFVWSLVLFASMALPYVAHAVSWYYLPAAGLLGAAFSALCYKGFSTSDVVPWSRKVFGYSIPFLVLTYIVCVLTRLG